MNNLKVKKYFYEDDISTTIFKGNGIGLSASLLAMSKVIPNQSFDLPILPSLLYFLGIIFAFFVHYISWTFNNDTRQRERRDNALQQFELLQKQIDQSPELESSMVTTNEIILQNDNTLLTIKDIFRLKSFQAWSYLLSTVCFLLSTSYIIYFFYEIS